MHCLISYSDWICVPSVTMRTAYWSPCGYNVSHQLLYLAHLSNIAQSRCNHACRRSEVNDFECAHWSNYFVNCWSVGDFSTQPAMVSEKNKRRHQVSPSSESKCVTDASFMPTAYLSILADHLHPFVTTVRRLPMATLSTWFNVYHKRWIISKWFLEHDTSVHYTRSYPQPNIAPFGWVGTGDSDPGCCSL